MSVTVLTVLWPNGRRHKVKVSPNSSILQVLEDSCAKQGFSSSDYELTFQNKVLDESCLLRFTGVPNNATLEVVASTKSKVDTLVTIALQLQESGERLVGQFSNSCCLWDILKRWEGTRSDILKSDSELIPVCIYMRQEVIGELELKKTSLRSLGLTGGNAVIRLVHRTEGVVEQAHVTSNLPKTVKPVESGENTPDNYDNEMDKKNKNTMNVAAAELPSLPISTKIEDTHQTDVQDNDEIPVPSVDQMELETTPKNETVEHVRARKLIPIDDCGSVIFHLDDMHIPAYGHLSDDFFEVTVKDVRVLQADLQRKRKALEEQPLLTQTYKTLQLQEKLAKYPKCVVRIQFPDRYVVQSTFPSESKVSSITSFLQPFLAQSHTSFYLYTSPPKTVLQEDQTLFEAGLVAAATVHFGCSDLQESYLSSEVLSKESVQECFDAGSPSTSCVTGNVASSSSQEATETHRRETTAKVDSTVQSSATSKTTGKVGKWFNVGKR